MPTNEMTKRKASKQRWGIPLVAVGAGVAYLVAGWLGDDLDFGVAGLIVMVGFAIAIVVLGRYSETVAGLLDRRDERINTIDTQATMFAGMVLVSAVIVGFIVAIARGQDPWPYSMLGGVGAVAYLVALVFLRFRR